MSEPFVIGLTGSIGMGKSTTAKMFADCGVPVWDADAAVHRLYSKGGAAIAPVSELVPDALCEGTVSREILKAWIKEDPSRLNTLGDIVAPLLEADRDAFLEKTSADIVLLDVPLLFEKGLDKLVDLKIVVTVDAPEQKRRILARPGMTEAQLEIILSNQMPDADKRARADVVIETYSITSTRAAVKRILNEIGEKRDA